LLAASISHFDPNPDLGRPEETTRHTSLTMHYFAVSIPSAKLGMDMRRHEFIALVRRRVGRLSRERSVRSGFVEL
jgi:hypothetical protein